MPRTYYVYILASRRNGTLYTGVTNDLARRTFEHRNGLVAGFTKRYGVHILVWYEVHDDIRLAIEREKHIKGWNRSWKLKLIERANPDWSDLSVNL
jgi:putative endonuclease